MERAFWRRVVRRRRIEKEVWALTCEGRDRRGGRARRGRVRLLEVRRPRVVREENFRRVDIGRDIVPFLLLLL